MELWSAWLGTDIYEVVRNWSGLRPADLRALELTVSRKKKLVAVAVDLLTHMYVHRAEVYCVANLMQSILGKKWESSHILRWYFLIICCYDHWCKVSRILCKYLITEEVFLSQRHCNFALYCFQLFIAVYCIITMIIIMSYKLQFTMIMWFTYITFSASLKISTNPLQDINSIPILSLTVQRRYWIIVLAIDCNVLVGFMI